MTCGHFGAVRHSTTRTVMVKAKDTSKMSRRFSAGTRARAVRELCHGLEQQGPVQQAQASTTSSHAEHGVHQPNPRAA